MNCMHKVFFILLGLVFWGTAYGAFNDIDQTYSAKDIKKIHVEHTEGKIHVSGANTDSIKVKARKTNGDKTCTTQVSIKGSVLEIKTARSVFGRIRCAVDLDLVVPQDLAIEGSIGASFMDIKNVASDLNLSIGAGAMEAVIGSNNAKIKVGAGKVNVRWFKKIQEGNVDLEVGSGLMTIILPAGMIVDASLEHGMGSVTNDVETSSKSKFKIKGKVGFGNIIAKYQ